MSGVHSVKLKPKDANCFEVEVDNGGSVDLVCHCRGAAPGGLPSGPPHRNEVINVSTMTKRCEKAAVMSLFYLRGLV